MVKIINFATATVISLLSVNPSYASMGENHWKFEKGEVMILDLRRHGQGFEKGCLKFTPAKVSFKVTVLEGKKREHGWMLINQTQHNENEYTFNNVNEIIVGFFSGIKYKFENITGQKVIGDQCDAGLID